MVGKLTFFCGKMGSGKSTNAGKIAYRQHAVLLSEDEWLQALYPDKIASLNDYIKYAGRLKPQIKSLVQSILLAGADVVMDFPANTVAQREWFRSIFSEIEAPHELVFIDLSDEICLEQIAKRRTEEPHRAATDTTAMFEAVSKHFVAPASAEAFNIIKIDRSR